MAYNKMDSIVGNNLGFCYRLFQVQILGLGFASLIPIDHATGVKPQVLDELLQLVS